MNETNKNKKYVPVEGELSREYRVDTLSSMSSVILPSQPKESKGTALHGVKLVITDPNGQF